MARIVFKSRLQVRNVILSQCPAPHFALKSMILSAAERAGGEGGAVAYLSAQATENPTAFLALLGKLVPLTAEGETGSLIVNLVRFADPT
jgi:hypothetical protein